MGDILNSCISKSLLRSDKAYEYDHVSDSLQKAVLRRNCADKVRGAVRHFERELH